MPRNPQPNFYLKPKDNEGKCLIYLQYKYSGYKLFFSFGQRINPDWWSLTHQRLMAKKKDYSKEIDDRKIDKRNSLNYLLDVLSDATESAYKKELVNGVPSPETLKAYLQAIIDQNKVPNEKDKPTFFKLIDRFISGEIKHKGKKKSAATLDNYKYFKKHLEGYQAAKKCKVDYDTISLDFFYKYTSYLADDLRLNNNTIAKDIRLLKAVMGEAVDLEETGNYIFKHKKFVYSEEETEAIYLTEKEIKKLFDLDLTGNKRLEQVRDLFVFACFVGLRFSDYSNVQPQNIVDMDGELYIKMLTQKTKERVIIPCNPVVQAIFIKYGENANKLPRAPSNQKFNEYIKEVGEMAGLKQTGRLTMQPDLPLYDCISSHTARRSFATNLFLSGFPVLDIMKITGHTTEKAFLKYIKVSKLDTAKRLNEHYKKGWNDKMIDLRIV